MFRRGSCGHATIHGERRGILPLSGVGRPTRHAPMGGVSRGDKCRVGYNINMSRLPGNWSWRDEQLAAAERSGQQIDEPGEDTSRWAEELRYWLEMARLHRWVTAAIVLVVVLLLFFVLRKGPAPHPRAVSHPPTVSQSHQSQVVTVPTALPWAAAEQKQFVSGLFVTLTTAGVLPRSGPALLWPVVKGAHALTVGPVMVALGIVNNSQESDRWVVVREAGGATGWLPLAAVIYSGTLPITSTVRPESYVITGNKPIQVFRSPGLPDLTGSAPQTEVVSTVSPGSVLPLDGVLPRYFDGKADTQWLRVGLPGGTFGWLEQVGSNLRLDVRYLSPPPGSASDPWVAPLPQGSLLLGAYGDALGTAQWPLRGGTDVRGKAGDHVQAVADGEVIFVGHSVRWARDYVVVRHTGVWDGWQTAYMGLISTGKQSVQVHEGQIVRRGQLIGYLAPGAYQQPTSLHFVVQTPDGTPIESQNVIQWP